MLYLYSTDSVSLPLIMPFSRPFLSIEHLLDVYYVFIFQLCTTEIVGDVCIIMTIF